VFGPRRAPGAPTQAPRPNAPGRCAAGEALGAAPPPGARGRGGRGYREQDLDLDVGAAEGAEVLGLLLALADLGAAGEALVWQVTLHVWQFTLSSPPSPTLGEEDEAER
jgi:hypothetical protein